MKTHEKAIRLISENNLKNKQVADILGISQTSAVMKIKPKYDHYSLNQFDLERLEQFVKESKQSDFDKLLDLHLELKNAILGSKELTAESILIQKYKVRNILNSKLSKLPVTLVVVDQIVFEVDDNEFVYIDGVDVSRVLDDKIYEKIIAKFDELNR